MKRLLFIVSIAIMSCCSTKKATETVNPGNPAAVGDNEASYENDPSLPLCIKALITSFRKEDKANPPRKLYSYTYLGNKVYYVPPICCDFFSDLYDGNCKLIGHPDGGFTGKGDGSAADFVKTRTGEQLVWEDKR